MARLKGMEGNVLHNWKEKEKLLVIFENEYFIHKNEDNFLGVLLILPPKNKEVLAKNLSLGRHNKIKRDVNFGLTYGKDSTPLKIIYYTISTSLFIIDCILL